MLILSVLSLPVQNLLVADAGPKKCVAQPRQRPACESARRLSRLKLLCERCASGPWSVCTAVPAELLCFRPRPPLLLLRLLWLSSPPVWSAWPAQLVGGPCCCCLYCQLPPLSAGVLLLLVVVVRVLMQPGPPEERQQGLDADGAAQTAAAADAGSDVGCLHAARAPAETTSYWREGVTGKVEAGIE